jgi:RNA polymerase sigma-70 factor (ECF subfamily)
MEAVMEDAAIIRRVRNGDTEAFSALVQKYHRPLLGFIYRLTGNREIVEDIGQEVFLNVYRSLSGFDETRGTPFSAWLFTAARNRCISELRRNKAGERISLDEIFAARSGGDSIEDRVIADEQWQAVQASLEHLPEPYRSTLLKSLQGEALSEIACDCGISAGTVKSRLSRAREKLKTFVMSYLGGKSYE